jgi:Tfp pilus assembly protein PilE
MSYACALNNAFPACISSSAGLKPKSHFKRHGFAIPGFAPSYSRLKFLRSSERGIVFSIELVFVFIVLVILLGLIYVNFGGIRDAYRRVQLESALTRTATEISGLYAQSSSYTGLDNATVIKAQLIDNSLVKSGSLQTPWGGDITIEPTSSGNSFSITIDDINAANCVKLSVYEMKLWQSITVNSTEFESGADISDIISACGDNNTITYTAR